MTPATATATVNTTTMATATTMAIATTADVATVCVECDKSEVDGVKMCLGVGVLGWPFILGAKTRAPP